MARAIGGGGGLVDLHFHDLRHEAGCRWLELGWPLHHVQEMLGHANLSQASTYLHASEMGLQQSMRRFDAARGNVVAIEPPRASASWPRTGGEKGQRRVTLTVPVLLRP